MPRYDEASHPRNERGQYKAKIGFSDRSKLGGSPIPSSGPPGPNRAKGKGELPHPGFAPGTKVYRSGTPLKATTISSRPGFTKVKWYSTGAVNEIPSEHLVARGSPAGHSPTKASLADVNRRMLLDAKAKEEPKLAARAWLQGVWGDRVKPVFTVDHALAQSKGPSQAQYTSQADHILRKRYSKR